MICPYCGFDKPEAEFTSEHVIPRALLCGGLEPTNPFKLPVCKRCNTLCGRFVDRPFIKSWFTHSGRSQNERRYLDFSRNPEIPFSWMGQLRESPVPGKVCDNWLGPTGDFLLHFHDEYPDSTQAGMPIPSAKEPHDPGFVVFYIRATNPVWHPVILKSVVGEFEGATLYMMNGANPPAPFQKMPDSMDDLKQKIIRIMQKPLEIGFQMQIDCGDRFMAKLALGFGGLPQLLKPEFKESEDAKRLRGFLWERDFGKRAVQQVKGRGFFSMPKDSSEEKFLAWKPGHIIYIADLGEFLALVPIFYGTQAAAIEIARDRSLWEGKIPKEGIVYVIAPGFKEWKPATLGHYLAARQGVLPEADELRQFLHKVENAPELPPVDVAPQN